MYRFSIRQLMLMTASVAAGFVMMSTVNDDQVLNNRPMAFLLGVISLLLAVGLAQQIIWPPPTSNTTAGQRTFRRFFLALVLCGIVLGIYRSCVAYPATLSATSQSNRTEPIVSELALPLWYFSLTLAMMTAPWSSGMAKPTKKQNRLRDRVINAAVVVGVFVYCLALTNETAFIFILVDIAIQGVFNGLLQGPAVGTSHYVEHVDRTPHLFRNFVQWQVITWPPAILACFGLIGGGANLKSRLWWLVLAILMAPACVNLWRLVGGQAKVVFPMQVSALTETPFPDAMLLRICFFLVVILLATRPTARPPIDAACDQTNHPRRATYASDHGLIGWALMAIGMLAIISLCQEYVQVGFLWYIVVLETAFNPENLLGPLMLFVGMQWQWRRFHFQESRQERWPSVNSRQYFLIPLVTIVLLVTALTAIPFGIAIVHVGL